MIIWHSSRLKISHKTLHNIDISAKILSLQCSWLCDENFGEEKIIPSHPINKYFGKSFKIYSCLCFDRKLLNKFPEFNQTFCLNGVAPFLTHFNFFLVIFLINA